MKFKALFFCLALVMSSAVFSQVGTDTTQLKEKPTVKVTKNDGSVFIGKIVKDDGREILMKTNSIGDVYIAKSDIKSITEVDKLQSTYSGNYREEGPFKSRYYFTNNALPLEKGDNYALVHLYGPEVHVAVSDRLSIGVMATWIASPIGLALKYVIPTDNKKLNFSLGTIMISSGYLLQARGYGGLHWVSMTNGSPGKNLTLSTGVGYLDFDFGSAEVASVSSIAGIYPVGERSSFIFDSMIGVSGNSTDGISFNSFFMPGMRFQKTERKAFQVALAGVISVRENGFGSTESNSFPVPMCSWFFKL